MAASTVTRGAGMLDLVEYEVSSGNTTREVLLYSPQGDGLNENNMTSSQQHFILAN